MIISFKNQYFTRNNRLYVIKTKIYTPTIETKYLS